MKIKKRKKQQEKNNSNQYSKKLSTSCTPLHQTFFKAVKLVFSLKTFVALQNIEITRTKIFDSKHEFCSLFIGSRIFPSFFFYKFTYSPLEHKQRYESKHPKHKKKQEKDRNS